MNLSAFVVIYCVLTKEIYSVDNQVEPSSTSDIQETRPVSPPSTLTETHVPEDPILLDDIEHLETGVSGDLKQDEEKRLRAIRNQKRKEQKKKKKAAAQTALLLQDEASTSLAKKEEDDTLMFLSGMLSNLKRTDVPEFFQEFAEDADKNDSPPEETYTPKEIASVDDEDPSETSRMLLDPEEICKRAIRNQKRKEQRKRKKVTSRTMPLLQEETNTSKIESDEDIEEVHQLPAEIISNELADRISSAKEDEQEKQNKPNIHLRFPGAKFIRKSDHSELIQKLEMDKTEPRQPEKDQVLPETTSESPDNVSQAKLQEMSGIEANQSVEEKGPAEMTSGPPGNNSQVELLEEVSGIEPNSQSKKKDGLFEMTNESLENVSQSELLKMREIEHSPSEKDKGVFETIDESLDNVSRTEFLEDISINESSQFKDKSNQEKEEPKFKKSKRKRVNKNKKMTSQDLDAIKLPQIIEEEIPEKSNQQITQLHMIDNESIEVTNVVHPTETYLYSQQEIGACPHTSQADNFHRKSIEKEVLESSFEVIPNIDDGNPLQKVSNRPIEAPYVIIESSKKEDIPSQEESEYERVFAQKIILQREASVLPSLETISEKHGEEMLIKKPLVDTESNILLPKIEEEKIQGSNSSLIGNEIVPSKSDPAILLESENMLQEAVISQSDNNNNNKKEVIQSDHSIAEEVVAVVGQDKQFQPHYDIPLSEAQHQSVLADHLEIDPSQLSDAEGQSTINKTESIHSAQSEIGISESQSAVNTTESIQPVLHPIISIPLENEGKQKLSSGEASQTLVSTTYKRDDGDQLISMKKSPTDINKIHEIDSLNIPSSPKKSSLTKEQIKQFLAEASIEPLISSSAIQEHGHLSIPKNMYIEFPTFKKSSSLKNSQSVASQLKQSARQKLHQVLPIFHETMLEAVDQHVQEKLAKILSQSATNYGVHEHKSIEKFPMLQFVSPLSNDTKMYELIEEIIQKQLRYYIEQQSNLSVSYIPHKQLDSGKIQSEEHSPQVVDTYELLSDMEYFVLITANSRDTDIIEELSSIGIDSKKTLGIERTILYPTTGNILLICSSSQGVIYLQDVLKNSSKLTVLIQTFSH